MEQMSNEELEEFRKNFRKFCGRLADFIEESGLGPLDDEDLDDDDGFDD